MPTQQNNSQETENQSSAEGTSDTPVYSWRAYEFIEHRKGVEWYVSLALVATILGIVLFLISSKDWVPVGVVAVTAIAFGIFASRKPRELEYTVSLQGVQIAQRFYPFGSFKSFARVEEDGHPAIWLMPLQRFMPIISLYFKPEEEAQIIDALSISLPLEDREPGIVDHLMQRIKF